jgi:hypothetical protein
MEEHSFLFAHKIFTEKLEANNCWQIKLECGLVIQLCDFKKEEKEQHKIWCPIHRKLEEILRVKQTKLTIERVDG